jgi:hypothetical protein
MVRLELWNGAAGEREKKVLHPQPTLRHGAVRRPLAPRGFGKARIPPARHHVDVRVQGLLHVAELGDVLEEDAGRDQRRLAGRVRTREREASRVRAGRPGVRVDPPLEVAHQVVARHLFGEYACVLGVEARRAAHGQQQGRHEPQDLLHSHASLGVSGDSGCPTSSPSRRGRRA